MNETTIESRSKKVELIEDQFGFYLDKTTGRSISVRSFTWRNQNSLEIKVITYGATIVSIKLPGKTGVVKDIVMGFDDMEGYLNPLNPYFGATVGRVANRIGNGTFRIDGTPYQATKNRGEFSLHGGNIGFDKVVWNYDVQGTCLFLSYLSKDGEEGFPGDLLTTVKYELTAEDEFLMEMIAHTTKPTIVNLTNHSYFNLAGHESGAKGLYDHTVEINADRTTLVDSNIIPTGELAYVNGTILDLKTPKLLGDVIKEIPEGGFDHNYCVNTTSGEGLCFVARAHYLPELRTMEVYSNQPGVQFYTANYLPVTNDDKSKLIGKNKTPYYRHGAMCFETQNYPDAVNHPSFPNAILRPGQTYKNVTSLRFPKISETPLKY